MKVIMKKTVQFMSLSKAMGLVFGVFPILATASPNVPDAGTILQQLQPPTLKSPSESSIILTFPNGQTPKETVQGGAEVVIKQLSFSGLKAKTNDQLMMMLGDVVDKPYNMSGLRYLADRIAQYYREEGYPFARTFLPPQDVSTGLLRIDVLEGHYGQVKTTADELEVQQASQSFLTVIQPNDLIESHLLERVSLILDDQPGYRALPIVGPGQQVGSGDLEVRMVDENSPNYQVSVDNFGSRFTGENRVMLNGSHHHIGSFGDEINFSAVKTNENMMFGRVGYSLPLNYTGLRGDISYNRTQYQLGKNLASLDAIGTADIVSLGVSYPFLRSQKTNVSFGASFQYKSLNDEIRSSDSKTIKNSNSLPVSINFDHRDMTGMTYGALVYTLGDMRYDDVTKDTANTRGNFSKLTLDVARLQSLNDGFSLFGRISAQKASKNLDGSEDLLIGGASTVRAYPQGEQSGDEGYFSQLELRYNIDQFTPYCFVDKAQVNTNASPTATVKNAVRSLSGYGLGLKYNQQDWGADVFVAWKGEGGSSTVDAGQHGARVWANLTYKF